MSLLAKASAEELILIRQACEADLLVFTSLFFKARLSMDWISNWHHELIVDKLMAVYRGEIKNLCLCVPPGSSKTELAVIHFMAWCLAREPHCRFLHISAFDELALLNSATAKEIVLLPEYQLLWPRRIRADTRSKKRWNIELGGKTAGGVYATSSTGQLTGFRAGYIQEGFSGAIIIDDPLKPEDSFSKARRETANRILTNTVRSRRATERTPVIMIMQRIHEDDPAARAIKGELGLDFELVEVQGVQGEGSGREKSYWELKESLDSFLALKEVDPYTYNSQIQQRPTPKGGNMIDSAYLEVYEALPAECMDWCLILDTAQKTSEKNDYSVLLLVVRDKYNIYLHELRRKRLEAPDLLKETIAFYHAAKKELEGKRFLGVYIEDKSSGTGLIQTLRRETGIPIIAIPRNKDKVTRVHGVLPYIHGRRVFVRDSPWLLTFFDELEAFSPAMTHKFDDQVDVLCDAIDLLLLKNRQTAKWDFS